MTTTNQQPDSEERLRSVIDEKLAFLKPNPNDYAEEAGYHDAAGDYDNLIDDIMQAVKDEIGAARIDELISCLKQVPMPSLSYEQVQNRIAELRNHFGIGEEQT